MKQNDFLLLICMLIVFLFLGGVGQADNRCPLTGHTYTFECDGTTWELSGFECTFGPGCEASCDLWYGDFETGPLYYERLPFVCEFDGDVIITVGEMKIPCALDSQGNLECLTVDVSGYYCTRLGGKTWCFPVQSEIFEFSKEASNETE